MTDRWKNKICRVYECSNYASRDIDLLPICGEHAWDLAMHYQSILTEAAKIDAQKLAARTKEITQRARGNREAPTVYYARIGDYIKIGFTTRLRNRLYALRVDELLAIEPGGPELERERHQDFRSDRIDLRRENFRPSEALTAHITAMRDEHGLPYWATLPRTTTITSRHQETA